MAYEECKRVVIQSVTQHIEELFTVQSGADEESSDSNDVDMEDLSRAYGLLLQATASKTRLAYTTTMQGICGKVYNIIVCGFVCIHVFAFLCGVCVCI